MKECLALKKILRINNSNSKKVTKVPEEMVMEKTKMTRKMRVEMYSNIEDTNS